MSKISFNVPYLNFSDDFEIVNNGKSTVIFGSNGMGKSSIYNAIKEKHPEYDYIDYSDMKNTFINGKGKEINVTPHVQQYNDLIIAKDNNKKALDVSDSLKRFDINSVGKVKEIAPGLINVQKSKEASSKFTINKETHESLSKLIDVDVRFLSKNLKLLGEIGNIDEDIQILKEEYLKDVLKHLEENLDDDCTTCPVCDSVVPNIKTIIKDKIQSAKQIKTKLLKEYKQTNSDVKNDQILMRFDSQVELSKSITEKDVLDYILVPEFEKIKVFNDALLAIDKLDKQIKSAESKMIESYSNLKNTQKEYTSYISRKFGVEATFSDIDHSIKIKLARHPREYSTGEFNLILFATKIFEYVGSDKKLMVLDDPISSYDIINQYKIAFDIVSRNKNNEKNFLIFTHNMTLINLINTQQRGVFDFKMADKVNDVIHMYSLNAFCPDSIMNVYQFLENASDGLNLKFIKLAMERDNTSVDETIQNKIHPLFHYDGFYQFDLTDHSLYDTQLSNDNLVKLVDDVEYQKFDKKNYAELVVYKICIMLGLRVWIEKKLFNALNSDVEYLSKKSLAEKISYALPKGSTSRVFGEYPRLERSDLMSRKVMLNQHEHFMSQGEPFYYVMNLSIDDIYTELNEVKDLFLK